MAYVEPRTPFSMIRDKFNMEAVKFITESVGQDSPQISELRKLKQKAEVAFRSMELLIIYSAPEVDVVNAQNLANELAEGFLQKWEEYKASEAAEREAEVEISP